MKADTLNILLIQSDDHSAPHVGCYLFAQAPDVKRAWKAFAAAKQAKAVAQK